jgi:hypothetical protein
MGRSGGVHEAIHADDTPYEARGEPQVITSLNVVRPNHPSNLEDSTVPLGDDVVS